MWLQIVH